MIVRENVEGEYSEVGGRVYRGTPREFAVQESVFTRAGIERVTAYAAELALERGGRVTSATKSNGLIHSMPFWDEVVEEVVGTYPSLTVEKVLVDALAAKLVLRPQDFKVIVASNLFGDILSDLVAALAGSIGLAPSANINPPRKHPSMFEPIHGSAPDIAGRGIANPIGQIWSAAMMLDHFAETSAATELMTALERTLASGIRTADLGGTADTQTFTHAVLDQIGRLAPAAN